MSVVSVVSVASAAGQVTSRSSSGFVSGRVAAAHWEPTSTGSPV